MQKIKFLLLFTAVVGAVAGALATRPQQACTMEPNYYWNGSGYSPAGVMGTDYICVMGNSTCTYDLLGSTYEQCQMGIYTPLKAISNKK